jgi:glycosyltransferase 2 family protein
MFTILKLLFFLGLGIGLIWLALRKTTDEEFANIKISFLNANYFWISLSILITGLSHYFRALRWKILLNPLGYTPKTSNTFFAVMVGYLANFAIHRMGEVTRCGLLTTYEKVPFTAGFGTVISERALDVICLIIIFFAALGLEFDRISGIANDLIFNTVSEKFQALMQKQTFVIVAGITLLLIAAGFYYFRKKIRSLFSAKVRGFFKGLWDGLISIKNVNKPGWFIAHTILIWLMYILQVYVCFFAFPETAGLSVMVAVVIVVFGSLGVMATPGGTGAYQLIVIQILMSIYFISYTSSFAFAWAVWTSQFIFIVLTGFLSLILLAVLNKEAKLKA